MHFQTEAQKSCYLKVAGWMDRLFGDTPWERLDGPGFGLFMGSAWVEVTILPWEINNSMIQVRSVVVKGAQHTSDLYLFLLQQNAELHFGAFALDREGQILLQHTIVGSTCDPLELETSVREVLDIADAYDDQIRSVWGGERALDQEP
ncbi:MAG: YbjN domain-containing protein [Synechococcaceae cyanobacterium SM2_3_1]|nr:YbjN domain-containing protein [Synechococcaceae cyanobacterium SM2_3_1]